jgi:UPF0042 nucleotide-binding protein
MSGAGKSQALKIFEDLGFICIDNMPVQMLESFVTVCIENPQKYSNSVISIDSRAGNDLALFKNFLKILKNKEINYKIIFFNALDSILLRRYSETRHKHPLGKTSLQGIKLERNMVKDIFTIADEVVDTSNLTVGELKKTISDIVGIKEKFSKYFNISVLSFGYKFGIPLEADIVFDVRFLTNPNYIHELKFKTGKFKTVQKYVEKQKEFQVFFSLFSKLVKHTIPNYIKEGKTYLTIAIGCTGGRHRSVFVAERLAKFLTKKNYKINLSHRDILQ